MGFSANKVSFSNAWNAGTPYYSDSPAMNDYFARNHLVLTQGAAKTDVAVYLRNYSSPSTFSTTDPSNRHWQDLGLQEAGYTWDYLDEHLFDMPNAVVSHERLAEAGPAYKALVFDRFGYPTSNTARGSLSIEAAKDILGYARAGLPVIFVGRPSGTGSLAQDDARLSRLVSRILAQRSVSQVDSEADVPAELAARGITPQARPAAPTSLLSQRRSDAATSTDFYWLYNQGVESWPGSTATFGLNPSNLYETRLEHGARVTSRIGSVPQALNLTNRAWHLDAEDWQPTNPYGTQGAAGSETTKAPVSVDLPSLQAWPDIPELQNASGVGTYRTSFSLPSDWDATFGATLDLGQVTDSFRVEVNGRRVAADQISGRADLGRYLRAGENTRPYRQAVVWTD